MAAICFIATVIGFIVLALIAIVVVFGIAALVLILMNPMYDGEDGYDCEDTGIYYGQEDKADEQR